MRRTFHTWAIAASILGTGIVAGVDAHAGDNEIAGEIMNRLRASRDAGELKDFTLDLNVDEGVVKFRGNVTAMRQRDVVLAAADGIEGVAGVVNELTVNDAPTAEAIAAVPVAAPAESFDWNEALERAVGEVEIAAGENLNREQPEAPVGVVTPVANFAADNDDLLVDNIIGALGQAKTAGQLRGFGVDVQSRDGIVDLNGRATDNQQRSRIESIVRDVPGVRDVRSNITLTSTGIAPAPPVAAPPVAAPLTNAPIARPVVNTAGMRQMPGGNAGMPAQMASHAMPATGTAVVGAPMATPVPVAPYAATGAPRYDTPNLPNYAWPGYAAHPNYAALTYPQQYSPSAWPYIGPFYPYPQVPLGWRKVSLEWDDGWWYLDFTDRDY